MASHARARKSGLPSSVALSVVAAVLGGCVTYSPSQLSAMSALDICEAQDVQGSNLTPETRQAMQSELARRKDNCANHAAEVAQRRADVMYELVYGSPDDP